MSMKLRLPEPEAEQKEVNYQTAEKLKQGEAYRFNPPVSVAALPFVPGAYGGAKPTFEFSGGLYETVENGHLVFIGFPVGATDRSNKWKFMFPVEANENLEIAPHYF